MKKLQANTRYLVYFVENMSIAGRNPTHGDVAALLPKFDDPDPDIRYMIMADLQKILASGQGPWLAKDYVTAARTIDVLLKALDDGNGDVQSAALSWSVSVAHLHISSTCMAI